MPPRNHKNWLAQPTVESISSKCYNNYEIFKQEQEQIFSKVWVPMCHISEMYNAGDFRTTQIAGVNVIAWNTGNGVKAYKNPSIHSVSGNMSDNEACGEKLYTEVKHGGMVWVTLDLNPTQSVDEWTAGAFDCIADAIDTEEMEVFHYHKAVINTNYKLWHDTNSEFYHDFMHYFN